MLPRTRLVRAQRLNPYWRARLKWRVPQGWPSDISSVGFAERVAQFQEEAGLGVDGVIGPKTLKALKGGRWVPPSGSHLIVAGRPVAVSFPVVTWKERDGLSFYGQSGWKRRRSPSGRNVDLVVLHWDGCTSSHQCFQVLLERGLAVHLMLDGDGTVYQALDVAEVNASHAGGFNERSVGIEIQNPVFPRRNRWQEPARVTVRTPRAHGRGAWDQLDFRDVQKRRVAELVEALCSILKVPRRLPRTRKGTIRRTLAPTGYSGVCGHYHLSRKKPDPGFTLWPAIEPVLTE